MAFFGVNFIFQKFCQCKKNDKYQVCQEIPQNTKNYQLEFPTGLTLKGTLAANSTLQTSSCDKHIKYDKCDKHITSSISLTRISQSTCHQVWNHFWNLIFLAKKKVNSPDFGGFLQTESDAILGQEQPWQEKGLVYIWKVLWFKNEKVI